jgi:hypothetical protein
MKRALLVFLVIFSTSVSSQSIPPPINLLIKNIMQETQVWCWAAVAQQIILARQGPVNTPPQCALVAMANGAHPNVCCSGMGNPSCVTTGSLQQIQYLIGEFGGSYSSIQPPANPMTLYNTLASGRPIILQVQTGQASAHVVVLTGMSFAPNGFGGVEPVLYINDPLAYYNQPVPFSSLIQVWMSAIVVG